MNHPAVPWRSPIFLARVPLPGILLSALLLAACGDGSDPSGPDLESRVTTISVSPTAATLTAIDDTHQLTASAADQLGATMSGVEFAWSSSDEDVATVDQTGQVTAVGHGGATITAAASGRQGTATVTVAQTTTSVEVSPPEATFEEFQQFQFEGVAEDANGHPLSQDRFTWSSTDPEVVTVNQSGVATGQSPGEAVIQASVDDAVGEAEVTIEPTTSPLVVSVSPEPLVEGEAATLTGLNFSPTPAQNEVLVDGNPAQVTAATETQLQIVVPPADCRPSRTASITVTVDQSTSPSHPAAVTPGQAGLDMAVGEHLLVQDPASFCLRFDVTPNAETYLIGVQSTSEVAGTLTPVSVRSVTGTGQAEGALLSHARFETGAFTADAGAFTGDAGRAPPAAQWRDRTRTSSRWRAHRESEAALRKWEREMLLSARPAMAEPSGRFGLFASEPQVGDIRTVRIPDRREANICTNFLEVDAVVRSVGMHGIWLEDPDNPANGFTGADFQNFSDQFDQFIYPTNVEYFGEPTDLDGNDRILVLVSKAVNESSGPALGFVFSGDFFTRASCPASDEGELFYGRAPDPGGTFSSPYATADARLDYPFIIAHELSHVIQVGRRLMDGAPFMDTWMMEGQASLAEEVVGHAVTGRSPGNNYGIEVAFNTLEEDEISWYIDAFIDLAFYYGFQSQTQRVATAPEQCSWLRLDGSPCLGRGLWYGVPWSLLRWISDQYGPSFPGGEAAIHREIVDGGLTGFAPLTDVTGEDRERLLAWWAATLYTDGRLTGGDPRLRMSSWNLFQIYQNLVPTARLAPQEVSFTNFQASKSVRAASTAYFRLSGSGRPETAIRVRDGSDGELPAIMQVWVVRLP